MGLPTWILDKLLKKKKEKLICRRCKEEIENPSYILVTGEIVTNVRTIRVFTCPEQAFNYAQKIPMHSVCWIDTLREHGIELYDMDKVYEEYAKRAKKRGK